MVEATPVARGAELLAGFPGALREAGLAVDPGRAATFLAAIRSVPLRSLADLSRAGRVTLVGSHDDFPIYDAIFKAWFATDPMPEIVESPDEEKAPPANRRCDQDALRDILEGEAAGKNAAMDEALGRKAFGPLSEPDRVALGRIARSLGLLPTLQARKLVPFERGQRIDVARTARAARRTAGETLRLLRKIRPETPRRMLLLVDVSGSMKAHSETTLRFAHLLARARPKVETFCFGTRLSRVTSTLRHRLADEALARLADLVFDFDGGTRIGASLDEFLSVSRHAALVRGAVTLVFSDGLERGDPAQMIHAVDRLARLSHRLVWLSPLAADPNYRPVTRAMAAILPALDGLVDGSNLPALEQLLKALPAIENAPRGEAWRRFAGRVGARDSLLFSARADLEAKPPFCGKK
ncbi:VWA domain-containing protein [Mesorhizobium sp. BAC0120]|uniref:vWA domain-containing protein n=1 Tax=Mesorhizobium sp. BAC0120 TaxID=3090670 RepID=UPI00298D4612|nr:VWA domain-containing protein [Mesorhizobium sp. BAC0120]MDW6020593.1 VWA domain-containing protein [Mesorhizobium sp. BAC0120]